MHNYNQTLCLIEKNADTIIVLGFILIYVYPLIIKTSQLII